VKKARLAVLLTSGLLTAALAVRADEKKMEAPGPAPEVKKLGYFRGTWNSEGEVNPNSFMPAGRYTWTEKCDWFPGGFHLVCYSAGKSPMGLTHGLEIFGYNPEEKTYTYRGIDSSGFTVASKGAVDGNNWTYTSKDKMSGKTLHGRYSIATSEASYTYKYETSKDGKNWTLVMEGKTKRPEKKVRPERERERERKREEPHEMK
jgi:Protein of unknown function (DUF1579)